MINLKKITKTSIPLVIGVTPLKKNRLLLVFSTGEIKIYDCTWALNHPMMKDLNDVLFFKRAHVSHGTVAWSKKIDLAPDDLYKNSVPLKDEEGSELMVG